MIFLVYVTGDCHADWSRFAQRRFNSKELTRDDYVIVCGDFGLWHDTPEERRNLNWLEEKNFTLLFVDGNHENFDRLYGTDFETVDFHDGKAHKIRDNIYHLKRGYVFELCGKKFFAFGGASSHDIEDGILHPGDFRSMAELMKEYRARTERGEMLRINHYSWWYQEMPSESEMKQGLKALKQNNFKVDYIISHCCPQIIASALSSGLYKPDKLTLYFNKVADETEFTRWYFGHYHKNTDILDKYTVLYDRIERVL